MAEIIPAIMPKTLNDLRDHVEQVAEAVKTVQIDIMDGAFVKNKSWPYIRPDDYFETIVSGEEGLPLWEEVNYEVDLMVNDPFDIADQWVQAGAFRILFHVESFPSFKEGEDISADMEKALSYKNDFTEVGLAIGVNTPFEIIAPYLAEISCVQVMGIKRIGYQGEKLDESIFDVIRDIREQAPELPISVDGGVNEENIGDLSAAGVTRFVSGSAVFNDVNPIESIRILKAAAYEGTAE